MIRSGAAAAVCVLAGAAWADTATLSVSQDNTVFSDLPSNSNGSGNGLFAGANQQGGLRRGLVAFDLSSIPTGSTVTNVTLTMNMVQTVGGTINVALHRVNSSWGEGASNGSGQGAPADVGDATWLFRHFATDAWTTPGGDYEPLFSAVKGVGQVGAYSWASTGQLVADVQGWLDNPASNFGWMLIGSENVNGGAKRFASREHIDPAMRPVLSVEYTPVPGPASLAVLGAAGAAATRRRRR